MRPTGSASSARARLLSEVGVVALGGGLGTTARYGLEEAIHPAGNGFPIATLLINVLGAALLALLVGIVTSLPAPPRLLRPAVGTGLIGGFTTFSTFAFETRGLSAPVGAGYVAISLVASLLVAALGLATGRALVSRNRPGAVRPATDPIDPDLP